MVLENFIVDAPIVWDRVGKKIFENPHVKQGRKMRVQITNAGMVEDLSGYTLALGWKHTVSGVDGLDVFEDSSEANVGIFEMAYTENLMTNLGNLKASLVLTSVEDMVVAESNDFYVKVDDSPFGVDAERGVGSYTRLAQILLNEEIRQEAYLKNEALVASIDDKFDAFVQTNIVQEEVAEVFNNLEETYAQDIVSVKQQLEQKVGGTVKAELEDLSATVLGAIDGTGGPFNLLSIPQDASVTPTKTTFFEYTKNLFDYKQAVFGKKVAGSGAVVDTIETDNDSYVANVMPVVAGLPYVRNAYGNFAFRDADGLVIGSAVTKLANSPVTAPVGAVTMVSSLIVDSSFPGIENVQIEQAESCTSFVSYGKLSYKQALGQNEVTLDNLDTALQDIVLQNLSADDYQPIKKYQAQVKNRTSVVFTDKQIKIHASFKFGEVKNERCIVVKDSAGNTIAHQWEDARNVNLNKNDNAGKYKDGSLRDGYLWIIDTCEASATNVYTVFVYPEEVTTITPIVSVTKNTTDDYTVIANGLTLNFLKAKRYLLESLNNNGTAETFLQRPAINNTLLTLGVSPTFYLNVEPKVTVDKFEVVGSGVVFVEAQTTLRFYPSNVDLFSVLVKTRLYANGIIKTECVFKPLRTIAAGEITGVMQRVSLSPNSVITKTTDVTQISWTNTNKIKAILAVNTNGDTPRGVTPTIPELPANVEIVDNSGTTGTAELLLGWKYSNNANSFEIESGKPFTNQIEYNFIGVDTAANEKIRALNELCGRINAETPVQLKTSILQESGKIVRHLTDYYFTKYAGSSIDGLYPPTAAKLAMFELYGIGDLNTISAEYKATLLNRYGTITAADLWTKRKADAFSLDIGGRVFPLAYRFWKLYKALNNTAEIAYYENIIASYAEMLCSSTEEKGFVGLLYALGYNSNSTSTGLRGLAIGMTVFGTSYASGRWQAAYNTNLVNLALFVRGGNILVDGHTQNLTTNNYYHYAMYASYEYTKATELLGSVPIFNPRAYAFAGSAAYGGLQEHKYCVSSSRRGLPHTYAYVIYVLSGGNVSDLAQAETILNHFIAQNIPTGGVSLPLDGFSNPPLNEKSELAICLGAFSELIFKLLDEKIK